MGVIENKLVLTCIQAIYWQTLVANLQCCFKMDSLTNDLAIMGGLSTIAFTRDNVATA